MLDRGPLLECLWPISQWGHAVCQLAARSGVTRTPTVAVDCPTECSTDRAFERWLFRVVDLLGVDARAQPMDYADLEARLGCTGPAIVRTVRDHRPYCVVIVGGRASSVDLLTPQGRIRRVAAARARHLCCGRLEGRVAADIEMLVRATGAKGGAARDLAGVLRVDKLRGKRLTGYYCLVPRLDEGLARFMGRARFVRRTAGLVAIAAVQYLVLLGSWWLVGRGALSGTLDPGWLQSWALALAALVALRVWLSWASSRLSLDFGAVVKRSLVDATATLDLTDVSARGTGELLGRIMESEQLEEASVGGGLATAIAAVELAVAVAILASIPGQTWLLLGLLAWLVLAVVAIGSVVGRRRRWVESRLELGADLFESMLGHATSVVLGPRSGVSPNRDAKHREYQARAEAMDRSVAWLSVLVPRGWLATGLVLLAPTFIDPSATTLERVVALGLVLVVHASLRGLASGASQVAAAVCAFSTIRALLSRATRAHRATPIALRHATGGPVLRAKGVVYRVDGRHRPVLDGVDLRVEARDRVLIEGPSGGGKSTLAALLAGLTTATEGSVLSHGLDRRTLGEAGWREKVCLVPQFHDNHIFAAPLAFNLLLGRGWPPRSEELEDAHAVCVRLGLGELLERMPGGLFQMVGPTGWQLSHGEKGRVFLARAILQRPSVILVDEAFAALDPASLDVAIEAVFEIDAAVIAIAHP